MYIFPSPVLIELLPPNIIKLPDDAILVISFTKENFFQDVVRLMLSLTLLKENVTFCAFDAFAQNVTVYRPVALIIVFSFLFEAR